MSTNGNNAHADAERCMDIIQNAPQITLHYLTEGNANVIYSIAPSSTLDPETSAHDHCCVLRMRKDLPTMRPCIENLTAIRERITPLFGDNHDHTLMPKVLYKLNDDVLRQASEILDNLDKQSATNGDGDSARALSKKNIGHPSLDSEPHAILMPNFRYGEHALFREFKPKWLQQSPNAPKNAKRCRTCAANAFKRSKGGKKGKGDSGFCPLDLLSSDRAIIRDILRKIDPEHGDSDDLVEAFVQQVQPVLYHLADLQAQYSTKGIDDASNPEHRDYAVAMALRDCSVFLVLQRSTSAEGKLSLAHVKLADLDLKISTAGNLAKWAKMESDLISSGAYNNTNMPGSACALERSNSDH